MHLDIWTPGEREPQAQAQSDAEARGPRGPSASREKWQAEGRDLAEDVRPGEKLWGVPGDQERAQ